MIRHRLNKHVVFLVFLLVFVSLFSVGFSAFTMRNQGSKSHNIVIKYADIQESGVSYENVKVKETEIRFDALESDQEGSIQYVGSPGNGEQLNLSIEGTIGNYSAFGGMQITFEIETNKQAIFNELVELEYIVLPTFYNLQPFSLTYEDSFKEGSFWKAPYNERTKSRDFILKASFKWGKFFNNLNPSVFFDSTSRNDFKVGKEYTASEKKAILDKVYELNDSVYTVTLSKLLLTYSVNLIVPSDSVFSSETSYTDLKLLDSFTIPNTRPTRDGYSFTGWWIDETNTDTNLFYQPGGSFVISDIIDLIGPDTVDIFLYARWSAISLSIKFRVASGSSATYSGTSPISFTYGSTLSFSESAVSGDNKTASFSVSSGNQFKNWNLITDGQTRPVSSGANITLTTSNLPDLLTTSAITIEIVTEASGSCLAPNTQINLADGTTKNVQDINTEDALLVFNHETGEYDQAPIIFNDYEEIALQRVLNFEFSNGTIVRVIYEHGFFDKTLNKYVYIGETNYASFIGHDFASVKNESGSFITEIVKLNNVFITEEFIKVYSPTTVHHLNVIVEGMLSMPAGIEGLFNFFEYDETLRYDQELMAQDIETYGLYTYDDFKEILPYEIYLLFPAPYLKVSVGKGYITFEHINYLIDFYLGKIIEQQTS